MHPVADSSRGEIDLTPLFYELGAVMATRNLRHAEW